MSVFRVKLSQGDTRSGDGNLDSYARQSGTITAASNASPIVITSTAHGLTSGRTVNVSSVTGNTNANGNWVITKISDNTFSLNGSTGNASYVSGGTWSSDSVARTMNAVGPNGKTRSLADGEQFTDCNYWKQFAYPAIGFDRAFIEVVTDDGTTYTPGVASFYSKVDVLAVNAATTYAANTLNLLNVYGVNATSVQISVTGNAVRAKINGDAGSILPIASGTAQTLDFNVGKLEFDNSLSGASNATVTILSVFPSLCNS